ncbi:serine-rich adhesin for platelets-like [Cucumis melo var. makuwa]|uniref:Serine-rich adhesin for platelets-like n=1 Tax=Cucumis melo var. makuwa TaxID=1194695 RepID=A0A5A7T7U1_CUCMM|nr:serine-rich adhesin for platelets-like [Cucumis melo var. makuwa]
MRPYGLHASFLPLAGLPLAIPLPEKLKRKRWFRRTHTSISLVIPSDAHINLVIPKDAHISLVIPKDTHSSLVIPKDTHISLVIPKDTHISLLIPKDVHISLVIPKDAHISRDPEGYRAYKVLRLKSNPSSSTARNGLKVEEEDPTTAATGRTMVGGDQWCLDLRLEEEHTRIGGGGGSASNGKTKGLAMGRIMVGLPLPRTNEATTMRLQRAVAAG